jgi:uncharacterized protein (TIGR00730 family)
VNDRTQNPKQPHAFSRITVYCGSTNGVRQDYHEAAFQMGFTLASHGICLVYGAGKTGLMGALADGVLHGGGEVIGIIPGGLNTPQLAHAGLTQLEVLPDIQQRKARMSELADAFITLPGGFGTFDELFETLTWAQIGLHHKPIGLLNTNDYFTPLLSLIDHALAEGFIYPEHRRLVCQAGQPEDLLFALSQYHPPQGLERWVNRDE